MDEKKKLGQQNIHSEAAISKARWRAKKIEFIFTLSTEGKDPALYVEVTRDRS